jgi:hypothetical protein
VQEGSLCRCTGFTGFSRGGLFSTMGAVFQASG